MGAGSAPGVREEMGAGGAGIGEEMGAGGAGSQGGGWGLEASIVGFLFARFFFVGGLRFNGGGRMTKKTRDGRMTKKTSENKPRRLFTKSSIRSRDMHANIK